MPVSSPTHLPSLTRVSGVLAGFHPLNEPATNTVLASGLTSSRRALGKTAFTGVGFSGSTLAESDFGGAIFDASVLTGAGFAGSRWSGSALTGAAFGRSGLDALLLSFAV